MFSVCRMHDWCYGNQYTGQTPPAPTRGAALKKQAAEGGESDEPQEVEEVNIVDLIPRTDISGSITETIISELNDKNWKVGGISEEDLFSMHAERSRTVSKLPPPCFRCAMRLYRR